MAIVWIIFYPLRYRVTDSLSQVQEHTERLRLGPLSRQINLKVSNAAGDEIGLGNIKRDAIFQFAFRPDEDVIVEDALGNDMLEDLNAKLEEDEEEHKDVKLLLEPDKALILKKGDMSVTFERLAARF